MNNVVFVTGNAHKANYFSRMIGFEIEHKNADVFEIQSLDADEVVMAKVKVAYKQLGRPVIVEDTSLQIDAMGRLPGTFIKWFLDELGTEKLCRLADLDPTRKAHASAIFAYFDGNKVKLFKGGLAGYIANSPKGTSGFGWNTVFIPNGTSQTLGEMDEESFMTYYGKIKRFDLVKKFLKSH